MNSVFWPERVAGTCALIAGGDSGIDRAAAMACAVQEAAVGIAHTPWEKSHAEETQRLITEAGGSCLLFEADLSKRDANRALAREVVSRLGGVDVLVFDAAYQVAFRGLEEFPVQIERCAMLAQALTGQLKNRPPSGQVAGEPGHDWADGAEDLTERESEILALICQGLTNDDIARRLYLSINTVKTYIRAAYRRMGVSTRSRAVIWGIEHGFRTTSSAPVAAGTSAVTDDQAQSHLLCRPRVHTAGAPVRSARRVPVPA